MTTIPGTQLQAAALAAKDGDVFTVTSDCPGFSLTGKTFPKGIVIENGVFTGPVVLNNCHRVTLRNTRHVSSGDKLAKNGVTAASSRDITIQGAKFEGNARSVVWSKASNFALLDSSFVGMTIDAVDVALSRVGLLARLKISGTNQVDPMAHCDGIQLWSRATDIPTADITIEDIDVTSKSQGVSAFNHMRLYLKGTRVYDRATNTFRTLTADEWLDDGGFDRLIWRRIAVLGGFPQGINMSDARNSVLENCHVQTIPGSLYQARIAIGTRTTLTSFCGNSHAAYTVPSGGVKKGWTQPACPAGV